MKRFQNDKGQTYIFYDYEEVDADMVREAINQRGDVCLEKFTVGNISSISIGDEEESLSGIKYKWIHFNSSFRMVNHVLSEIEIGKIKLFEHSVLVVFTGVEGKIRTIDVQGRHFVEYISKRSTELIP